MGEIDGGTRGGIRIIEIQLRNNQREPKDQVAVYMLNAELWGASKYNYKILFFKKKNTVIKFIGTDSYGIFQEKVIRSCLMCNKIP